MTKVTSDSRRNPDTMTSEERFGEIAGILARGLVRAVRAERDSAARHAHHNSESPAACLELCESPSVSVGATDKSRLAGEGDV